LRDRRDTGPKVDYQAHAGSGADYHAHTRRVGATGSRRGAGRFGARRVGG
jgi:hypothetical protein